MQKITKDYAEKIEKELKEVNGKAKRHTFTTYSEIEQLAVQAEKKLENLLNKKDRQGVVYTETSGDPVSSSYDNTRLGTYVELLRRSECWFLSKIKSVTLTTNGGGKGKLYLTKKNDEDVLNFIRRNYILREE